MSFVPLVRSAIHGIDKNQPVAEIGTLEKSLARSTAMPRFTTCIIGVVSGLALMIAVIGVYGLLAYTVAQRMPELGIRLIGASPLQVSWLMLASHATGARRHHWRPGRLLVANAMAAESAIRRAPARSCDLCGRRGLTGADLTRRSVRSGAPRDEN